MQYNNEILLKENKDRFVILPINYPKIWQHYKRHEASFWTAEEIDLGSDLKDWSSLNDGERLAAWRGTALVGAVKSAALVEVVAHASLWEEAFARAR